MRLLPSSFSFVFSIAHLPIQFSVPALEKANLRWHGWHAFRRGLATNLHRLAGDLTNSPSRERHDDDEHLREDGKRGRGECDEDLGNDVCNYCATRNARRFTRDVEVVRPRNLQVSTLDAVRGIWRRGGIRTPGTSSSSYNGLADCPIPPLVVRNQAVTFG